MSFLLLSSILLHLLLPSSSSEGLFASSSFPKSSPPPFQILLVRSPPKNLVQDEIFSLKVFLHTSSALNLDVSLAVIPEEFDALEEDFFNPPAAHQRQHIACESQANDQATQQLTLLANTTEPTVASILLSMKTFGAKRLLVKAYTNASCEVSPVTIYARPRGILRSARTFDFFNFLESRGKYARSFSPPKLPASRLSLEYKHSRLTPNSRYWSSRESLRFLTTTDALSLVLDVPHSPSSLQPLLQNMEEILPLPGGSFEASLLQMTTSDLLLSHLKLLSLLPFQTELFLKERLSGAYRNLVNVYRRPDGSFTSSVLPQESPRRNDSFRNVLPTAIVAQTLLSAQKFVPVDRCVVEQALSFLATHQKEDGSFSSPFEGGSQPYVVTARVLSAFATYLNSSDQQTLNRCGSSQKRTGFSVSLQKGAAFLEGFVKFYRIEAQDSWPLSVIAAFLTDIGHPKAELFFYALRLGEVHSKDTELQRLLYWESQETPVSVSEFNDVLLAQKEISRSITSVETAAYALMAYLKQRRMEEAFEIAQWLLTKQREAQNGGFRSFTDTSAALRALAAFARTAYELMDSKEFALNVTYDDQLDPGTANLTKRTPVIFDKVFRLDSYFGIKARNWGVAAEGERSAGFISFTWNYLLQPQDFAFSYDLNLNAKVESLENGKFLDIETCVLSTAIGSADRTPLVVMEVETPSGYEFDYDNLKFLLKYKKGNLRSFLLEKEDSKIILYIEAIPYKKSCVELRANRFAVIGNPFVGSALLYDFFDTSRKAQVFFEVPNPPGLCEVCRKESFPSCNLVICDSDSN